jgi:predicted porin
LENLEMKKTLVAIAALAATGAFAQSSVTIDGGLDAGYQAINYKGNKVSGINGNGSSTSQINFRGVSDLGGGLKADFRVESDWNTASNKGNTGSASTATTLGQETVAAASAFGNGELRVGLSGGFGRVDLGAPNMNTLTTLGTGQPFGTAIGGGYASVTRVNAAGNAVRDDNAVKYTSPAFMGLTASLYKSNKQTKASAAAATSTVAGTQQTSYSTALGAYDKLGSQEVGLNYANGPIAGSYSTLKQDSVDVGTGTTATTVNTLGANYTMGAFKALVLNQTVKTTTGTVATDTNYTALTGTYTMGNTVLMASTGSLKQDVGSNAGKKSKLTGLGADYNLSKTTALYARYEKIDDQAGAISAAASIDGSEKTRTRTAIGLRTSF